MSILPFTSDHQPSRGERRPGRGVLLDLHAWLATPPANMNRKYADFYALSNYTHAMGLIAHVLFLILFSVLHIEVLVWFNAFSILVFMLCLYWSKHVLLDQALLLGGLEVAAHQGLVVVVLGLGTGFHQYVLILVAGTLFFSHIRLRTRVVMAILPVCWYVALLIYGTLCPPWHALPRDVQLSLAIVNAVMFVVMLMGMAIYFQYSVARARTLAEKMAASKTLFLANMSHELRTPLNAILGFSQILNRSINLTGQDRANLATINRSGEHLLNLINRILDMSKLEEGKLDLRPAPFLLDNLMADLREVFGLVAATKGLTLDVRHGADLPRAFSGDELRLRQVLINLVGNAIKFTESGGIRVRVALAAPLDGTRARLRFEVEDDGIGIARSELGDLFQLFSQTESGRQSRHGTGLGLALCRRFVELMGGDIRVDSEPGVGSRFTFEVDLTVVEQLLPAAGAVDGATLRLAPDITPPRLLVVDDNVENRDVLSQLLSGWGFEVVTASDGAEAVARWREVRPALTWMDLRMPVMDGFTACQAIHRLAAEIDCDADGHAAAPLIVAITASSLDNPERVGKGAGFAGVVGKPFHEAEIRCVLEARLGVRFVAPAPAPDRAVPVAPAQPAESDAGLPPGLADLPQALIDPLVAAVELADFDAASQAIEAIAAVAPRAAAALTRLLANYRFDRLQALLEQAGAAR